MAHGRYWVQRLADSADLHTEPLPGVPVVEVAGDRRVLIERHRGVTEYSTQRIRVELSFGAVCICGENLEMTRMTRQQLVVTGRVDSVQLQRRCCP